MKNLLFVLVAVTAVTFASCSKSNKLNKRLDGTWEVTKLDGESMEDDFKMEFTFDKESGGKGNLEIKSTITFMGQTMSETTKGTYTLEKDEKITIKTDDDEDDMTAKILEYSKTDMKWEVEEDGEKFEIEMKKK